METFVGAGVANFNVAAASGNTPDIDVRALTTLTIDVTLKGLAGGTAPTVQFTLFRKTFSGIYVLVGTNFGAALAANGTQTLSAGPGMPNNVIVPQFIRISWVTTGTPTTALLDVDLSGEYD